jgi:hypothetical protein
MTNTNPLTAPAPYAIRNGNGKYYTGCTGERTWSASRFDAFTYTAQGAQHRIESCPLFFRGCTIEDC